MNQAKIHMIAHSEYVEERCEVAEIFDLSFSRLTDKEQAWKDLLDLAKDEVWDIRYGGAEALGSAFLHMTNKEQAWKDLLALARYKEENVYWNRAQELGSAFPHLTNKEQAWKDLLDLTKDEEESIRWSGAEALGLAFHHMTNKEQAWKDLLDLAKDEVWYVRCGGAEALGSAFLHMTNKEHATKDLLDLAKDAYFRLGAINALGSAFPHLTNKKQATKDLLDFAKDGYFRWRAINALGSAFPHLTDKERTTKDLLIYTKDEDGDIRRIAVHALGSAFPHMTDKEQVCKNLFALAKDEDSIIRREVAKALGSAFPYMTDKEQVCKNLFALAKDENSFVQYNAAKALSSAARHCVNEKDFKTASQCFSGTLPVFKYGLLGHIKPEPWFYLYKGLGYYYQGRALVSELLEKDPEGYIKNIKKAVSYFSRSIKYTNKYSFNGYENETCVFPICLNIYSALYEYNLSYYKFDKKRIVNIKNYLDNASAQCKIVGNQQGEDLVEILEKLTSSLKIRLEEIEQIKKKRKAAEKGKGGGWDAKYEIHIDKLKKDFEDSLVEIDNAMNKLEAPLFKKIVAIEREGLEKLPSREPKTSWQRLYKIINEFFMKSWGMIVRMGVILGIVVAIIKIWQFYNTAY